MSRAKVEFDFWKTFTKTFFQYDILFFYSTTLISGLEYSQYTSFLFVYLKEMDAPSSLLTLSIVSSSIASAVCFPYVQKIIQLLGGKWRAIFFTFVMYFVRYMGISLIRNSWLVLIFQTIHGLTTCLLYTSPSPRDRG